MHEDGRRTLIETIFYFEHATRELPLDVILGIAIGGSVLFAFAPYNRRVERTSGSWRTFGWVLLTAIILSVILFGTAVKGGTRLVLEELLRESHAFWCSPRVWFTLAVPSVGTHRDDTNLAGFCRNAAHPW